MTEDTDASGDQQTLRPRSAGRLVLASASPRRSELLKQIGVRFEVCVSNVAEEADEASLEPHEVAAEHARDKALKVAARMPGRLVLGADTVVVLDGRPLGKPADRDEARRMLRSLSGCEHEVITAVALAADDGEGAAVVAEDHVVTQVCFRKLSEAEIEAYVASGEPMDKAGGYGIQGLGAILVHEIRGCYFNVVGLPLSRTWEMLREVWGTLPAGTWRSGGEVVDGRGTLADR